MEYFTSDPHFGQKNIVRGVTEWKGREDECRPFETIEEMNDCIVTNINRVVKESDTLYCMGDWSFGGIENIWDFRKQLNVREIHLLLGNHDHHIEKNKVLLNVNSSELIKVKSNVLDDFNLTVLAQDIFTSVSYMKEIKIGKTHIILCHYPIDSWKGMSKGFYHLHGHCHGRYKHADRGKRLDVGLDSIFNIFGKFAPISITEVHEYMKDRDIYESDHHNENSPV